MAPTAPKKRPSIRTKTSKSGSGLIARPPPSHRAEAIISDSFISSKRDKRTIKSSAFLNRIEKANSKPLRRRRPNKKLVTTMEGLADALPDVEQVVKMGGGEGERGKIQMKSLTSGKGLMKRRGKVEKIERERFGKNLALLMNPQTGASNEVVRNEEGGGEVKSATASRFAALRAFIGQTMEKEKAFE